MSLEPDMVVPNIHDGAGASVSADLGAAADGTAAVAAHAGTRPASKSSGTVLLLRHGMSQEEIDRNKAHARLCDLAGRGNTDGIRELLAMHTDFNINDGDYDRRALLLNFPGA